MSPRHMIADLAIAARFARRELRGGLRGFVIFLSCLTLGVGAIAAVGSVREAIQAGLTREGARLLGGDAELRFTYRFASAEEREWMESVAERVSEVVDFRSMLVADRDGTSERALVAVKAVDSLYPLTGDVVLDPPMPLASALAASGDLPGIVVAPDLAERLQIKPGDRVRLGTRELVVTARLEFEPDNAGGFAFAPRALVIRDALKGSSLLAPGSLFDTSYRLDLPPGSNPAALAIRAGKELAGSGMRWRDARNGAPGLSMFVQRLGAFLVLVGISGLAVGGVGVSAAVAAYIARKSEVIATLRSLGAGTRFIFMTYSLQIGALAGLGIVAGLVLGTIAPLFLSPLLSRLLPVPAIFSVYPAALAEAAIYGVLTALLFTLWPLARTEDIRAASLFRDSQSGAPLLPRPFWLAVTAVILALLLATATFFSGALALTAWSFAALLGAFVVLALAAGLLRVTARKLAPRVRSMPSLRWALGAIGGPGTPVTITVLSLGLGLAVLAATGQIDGNLRRAIANELPEVAPSYFLVDIQRDQMPGIMSRLGQDSGVTKVESAPMLRGVITAINGRPAAEVAGDHWVLRGDRGVTYSRIMPANTRLTAGSWWPADYQGPPQISFASEEAEEMGLSLGDMLTVNILGRDLTARITSFREVDFSTAGIGFIMSMNPAALEAAPHSFIATIHADRKVEGALVRELAEVYPNVTAVRVADAIARVTTLLEGIAAATAWGASATLLAGLLVLTGATAAGDRARSYEAAILRALGSERSRILASFALRAVIQGAGAGMVALVAGIAGGWAVMHFVMDSDFTIVWLSALTIVFGGIAVTAIINLLFARRSLSARPARTLRARE